MNEILVTCACGTEKEFENRSEAKEGASTHRALCETCEEGDIEIVMADEPEVVETDVGPVEDTPDEAPPEPQEHDLPEEQPGVDTDPLDWVPSDFIDTIDGQPAINRKGYDVLAHHYGISVTTTVLVSPEETEYEYAEVKATAVTSDGIEYSAHGSAHVERGDDSFLLLEMADTRAAKRATARATGVGMIAVEELQNEL